MEYTKLGNTDITISKICVGCMSFGKAGVMHDWTLDEAETETVVKHALDLGINFFDTANCYSAGTSEHYLGQALKRILPVIKSFLPRKSILIRGGFLKKPFIGKLMAHCSVWKQIIWIFISFTGLTTKPQLKKRWKP